MTRSIVIEVERLRKVYGPTVAVDDISFEVYKGEIFGMVGPNGAGKTTTIECLEGLRTPDGGTVRVLGLDPQRDGYALRERIGLQLQESALPERLRVWEALDLYSAFYPKERLADPEELLAKLGLREKRDAFVGKLSGGQKQRLFIALALLNRPELVFLDELTTGLDPQARRAMWALVEEVRREGTTVFLTTHYMEEAERLCDRVCIIDKGRIVALDSPERLIAQLGADHRIVFALEGGDDRFDPGELERLPGVERVERRDERVFVYGREDRLIVEVVRLLVERKLRFRDLRVERPSLEDVFLALTGKEMRD